MGNTGDGLALAASSPVLDLTPEQRANLALVQTRLGVDDFENPNMADTPGHLVEHDMLFKRGAPHEVPDKR